MLGLNRIKLIKHRRISKHIFTIITGYFAFMWLEKASSMDAEWKKFVMTLVVIFVLYTYLLFATDEKGRYTID